MSEATCEASERPAEEPAEKIAAEEGGFRCDFCGRATSRVRRVALDRGYERLRTPHRVRYACPDCSERKERERTRGSA